MKSFFKSYFLTILIMDLLSLALFSTMLFNMPDSTVETPNFFIMIAPAILIFSLIYLVLMIIVAWPFFALVKKYGNFSWGSALIMGFLMHIVLYIFGLLMTDVYRPGQLIPLILVGVIFGVIFAFFYKIFQKREKPKAEEIQKIFT